MSAEMDNKLEQSESVQDFFKQYGIPMLAENLDLTDYPPQTLAAFSVHELQDNFVLSKGTAKTVYDKLEPFRKPETKKQQIKGITTMVQQLFTPLTPNSRSKNRKPSFMSEFEHVSGIDFKYTDAHPMDPCSAANGGSTEFFQKDFARNFEEHKEFANSNGWTPLMYACALRRDEIVKTILSRNPNICVQNVVKQTALMIAACFGHVSSIDLLIQYAKQRAKMIIPSSNFADIAGLHLTDETGFTALHWAVHYAQDDAVRYLLNVGANPNTPDKDGMTPTLLACGDVCRRKCLTELQNSRGDLSIRNNKNQNGYDLQKALPKQEEQPKSQYGHF